MAKNWGEDEGKLENDEAKKGKKVGSQRGKGGVKIGEYWGKERGK